MMHVCEVYLDGCLLPPAPLWKTQPIAVPVGTGHKILECQGSKQLVPLQPVWTFKYLF